MSTVYVHKVSLYHSLYMMGGSKNLVVLPYWQKFIMMQ